MFWWWGDAMKVANDTARMTGKRWSVRPFAGMWRATEVGAP